MITKLVKVPEKESYSFCKRIMFRYFGSAGAAFATCLNDIGWTAYPFYENDMLDPTLLLFTNKDSSLNILYNEEYNTKYRLKVIITECDIDNLEADEKIYIDNLEEYYKTELSLDEFIKNLMG